MNVDRALRIHPTAIIETDVTLGAGTAVWDNVHVRGPSCVGANCIIGEKTYIGPEVRIGDTVKINAQAYICAGVTIDDRVMIAAGVIFTNERYPRAFSLHGDGLAPSGMTDDILRTRVRTGATIGAGTVVGPGVEIGAYAMVGMGSVVTRDVPPYSLAYGNPARVHGRVCTCGLPVRTEIAASCPRCGGKLEE